LVAKMVTLPKFAPRSGGSIVLNAPKPMVEGRLVYLSP
jgi:hypothetical protein